MEENSCLEYLLSDTTAAIRTAWGRQIADDLLWRVCCEAVAAGNKEPLEQWREALQKAQKRIKGYFGLLHLEAARAVLSCADLALLATTLMPEGNKESLQIRPRIESLRSLLDLAARTNNCTYNQDEAVGALVMALEARELRVSDPAVEGAYHAAAQLLPRPVQVVDTVFDILASRGSTLSSSLPLSWVWDVTRMLLKYPRRIVHRCEIPVAAAQGETGLLTTLVLEVVEPGCGQVFLDRQQVFRSRIDEEFLSSMNRAWDAARVDVTDKNVDGRWRVLGGWRKNPPERTHLPFLLEADSSSASGAAARGWWFALRSLASDDAVVAVMQVGKEGRLEAVADEGIVAKMTAIATDRSAGFDTVIFVSASNMARAKEALDACGRTYKTESQDDLWIVRLAD